MEEKHSRLGVASFVVSVAVGTLIFALFIIAGVLHAHYRQTGNEHRGEQEIVGAIALLLLAMDIVAVGLGIAAVCQQGTKKVLGILGLSFSSLTIIGTGGLIFIGITLARAHGIPTH